MTKLNNRQTQILEQIQTEGELKTSDLKARYNVTEMTIRRDLEKLESTGKVRRTFGGVIWVGEDIALQVRSTVMQEEKITIGKKAASVIRPGESIFIDGGSTTYQLAQVMKALPGLTVVTNALNVAAELQKKGVSVIVTGGIIRESTSSLIGPLTFNALSKMAFDRVFLGTSGFTIEHGFSNTNLDEAEIKRLAIKQAKKSYVVMDHTKFGAKALYSFADLRAVQYLITDQPPDQTILQKCTEAGLIID